MNRTAYTYDERRSFVVVGSLLLPSASGPKGSFLRRALSNMIVSICYYLQQVFWSTDLTGKSMTLEQQRMLPKPKDCSMCCLKLSVVLRSIHAQCI